MLRSLSIAFVIGVSTLAFAGGCSSGSPDGSDENVASAVIAITNAPTDVRCVEISVQGTRTVERSFDVVPGQSTQFQMSGLPAGSANFSGNAFNVACASTNGVLATWVADPVAAQLQGGTVAQVTLPFRRNVQAQVNADFVDDGTCQANGAPCSTAAECCSTLCVGGACQAQQCGGNPCTTNAECCSGMSCVNGVCTTQQCLPAGSNCAGSPQPCCNGLVCSGGICGGTGGCSQAGSACAADADCCSGLNCLGGICQTASCSGPNLPCQPNTPCCSGLTCPFPGGPCMPGGPCQPSGTACVDNTQCCSLLCDPTIQRCL